MNKTELAIVPDNATNNLFIFDSKKKIQSDGDKLSAYS